MSMSLSYKAGYFAAEWIHYYMSERPELLYKFAAESDISARHMKLCKISAAVLFLFFITDIHRYGAWYTGNAAYVKPYWQYLYIILWLPLVFAVLRYIFYFFESKNLHLLQSISVLVITFGMVFMAVCGVFLSDDLFCLINGFIYLTGDQLVEAFAVAVICMMAVVFGVGFLFILTYEGKGRGDG